MTTIEVRYGDTPKLGYMWPIWGLVNAFVIFGAFLIAAYALALGVRFAVSDPHYVWSDKFSVGHSMTDLRVYEPLETSHGDFRLQMTVSDVSVQGGNYNGR